MTNENAYEIDSDRAAQKHREPAEYPSQIGGLEIHKTEEVHSNERLPATPHIHEHYGQGVSEEDCAHEKGAYLKRGEQKIN